MVNEVFGGWGFMAQDGDAVHYAKGVEKLWEPIPSDKIPESAAYDPARKCIYVSNYDGYNPSTGDPAQSIAKLTSEGKLVKADWLPGVSNPTGLEVRGDILRIVEPKSLVEVDIPGEKAIRRIPIPGAAFLNDVASAPDGTVFISDSRRNIIFAVKDGKAEEWLKNPEIGQPNGLLVHQGSLLVGNNADGYLKAVDLNTRMITRVANLGNGVIDGIAADRTGAILVSHNEGRIFRVSGNGDVEKILDTTVQGTSAADFCYVPDLDLARGSGVRVEQGGGV